MSARKEIYATEKEDTIKILVNYGNGIWNISKTVIDLYNSRMTEKDVSFTPLDDMYCYVLRRDDNIIVEIFEENSDEFDDNSVTYENQDDYKTSKTKTIKTKTSKTKIEYIPKKFKNYYYIGENYTYVDGYCASEKININIEKYNYDILNNKYDTIKIKIKEILLKNMKNEDKLIELSELIKIIDLIDLTYVRET